VTADAVVPIFRRCRQKLELLDTLAPIARVTNLAELNLSSMARYVWLMAFAFLTIAPHGAAGQEPLTLDRAVTSALSQNASLRASRSASAEAAAHITEARSGFFPRVSFVESWQRGNQPVFVFSSLLSARRFAAANFALDALNHPDAIGLFHANLGAEQLLFDGGRQRSAVTAASLQRDIAATMTDQAAAALVLATTETFGRVIAAEAVHQAAEAGLAAAQEDLARAERRRDAGMATDADVLGLAVHVADVRQRSILARGDSAIARAELNRLMGVPIDREFRIVEPAMIQGVGETPNVAALLAEADAARPELRRAAAAEQLADVNHRQARAAFVPQVAAQAAVDVSGTRFNDRASSWLVGGELRWTFSTGGAELAQMKAASEAGARARAEREDARAAIQVEVVSALRRLESARARQAAGRAAVDQARESQRIVRDRFEAGMASVNDVLRASTAALDAESNRASAFVDAFVCDAMLRRALGRTQ
jgi:outer membrane protein